MAKRKRNADEILEIRAQVAELLNRGTVQHKIAKIINGRYPELDYTYRMVLADIAELREEWRQRASEAIDQERGRMVSKLETMEAELWEQWTRSCGQAKKTRVETSGGGRGAATAKQVVEVTEQCGDPRYMAQLINIFERRARLLGLDAPMKVAPTDPDGGKYTGGVIIVPATSSSIDEWERAFGPSARGETSQEAEE